MITVTMDAWRKLHYCQSNAFATTKTPNIFPHHINETDNGRFIITNCSPDTSYYDGGTLFGYLFALSKDHQDLVSTKPEALAELRQANGRFHGKLFKIENIYHILLGPPTEFVYQPPLSTGAPCTLTPTQVRTFWTT